LAAQFFDFVESHLESIEIGALGAAEQHGRRAGTGD